MGCLEECGSCKLVPASADAPLDVGLARLVASRCQPKMGAAAATMAAAACFMSAIPTYVAQLLS
jgi:hypothetical protein